MAANKGSRSRSKDNLNAQKGSGGSGQVDNLQDANTGMPSLKSPRISAFTKNGATPGNPFGHDIPNPLGK